MIQIKPHHFMDIMKLHGAGFQEFVPDETMGHDFYKIGNEVLHNPNLTLTLTIEADDICKPCKVCQKGVCIDAVSGLGNFTSKDDYNKTIDRRILSLYNLNEQDIYTMKQLCGILSANPQYIFEVWLEENESATKRRYELFVKGAKQYLKNIN